MTAPDRPLSMRMLDVVSVAAFAAASVALVVRLLAVPWERSQLFTMGAAFVIGYVVADLASGVVHWLCDTFFQEDTPVIGRAFIHPFREHHVDPLAITRHDFFEVNGNNCLALVPVLAAVLVLGASGPGEEVPALFLQVLVLSFALATFATNQFHKWAHQPRPSAAVRWLQSTGLILSPSHHDRHHSQPYRQAFCITAGWLDPLLDRTRLFERIERAIRSVSARTGSRGASDRSAGRVSHGLRSDRVSEG